MFKDYTVCNDVSQLSKKQLELSLNVIHAGIIWANVKGAVIYANSKAYRICDALPEDEKITHIFDFVQNALTNDWQGFLQDLIKKKKIRFNSSLTSRKGKDIKVIVHAEIFNDTNKDQSVLFSVERMLVEGAEEKIFKSNLYQLFDEHIEIILFVNNQLQIVYCNKVATGKLSYADNIVLGNNLLNLIHPSYRTEVESMLIKAFGGEKIPIIEIQLNTNGQANCFTEANILPLVDKGDVIGVFATLRDITNRNLHQEQVDEVLLEYEQLYTSSQLLNNQLENEIIERKKVENELVKAKAEAEFANKAKSEFLTNMSHEIRTPLNAVLGFAEILKEKLSESSRYLDYIDGINTGGRSLLALINDILDLSKIEAGKLDIHKEPVSPYNLLNEVKQIFLSKIRSKGLELILDINSNIVEALELDSTRVRQILFNLVGNAVKFTSDGTITILAETKPIQGNNQYVDFELEVCDTGIGIPRKEQKLIFEPFKQMNGQDARRYGGTGLGLAITRRLVEMLNGSISVKSRIANGAKFKVILHNVKVLDSATISKSVPVSQSRNIQFQGSKVLIVDDSISGRSVFKGFLESYNLKLFEAENGKEAVIKAIQILPDIIFMDVRMPILDGFKAAEALKRNVNTRFIPIIALSGSLIKNVSSNEVSNFSDFLLKPATINGVFKILREFLPYTKIAVTDTKKNEINEYKSNYLSSLDQLKLSDVEKKDLCKEMQNKIADLHQDLSNFIDIDDVRDLASYINKMGAKFKIDAFIKYGNELLQFSSGMQIGKIKSLLRLIPEFIKITCTD